MILQVPPTNLLVPKPIPRTQLDLQNLKFNPSKQGILSIQNKGPHLGSRYRLSGAWNQVIPNLLLHKTPAKGRSFQVPNFGRPPKREENYFKVPSALSPQFKKTNMPHFFPASVHPPLFFPPPSEAPGV